MIQLLLRFRSTSLPASRSDRGVSRKIDDDLKEQIRYLKYTYPRHSAVAIFRQLKDNGSIRSGQLSEATVCRFITGANVFFNDTFVNLMSVIKSAVAKYGFQEVTRDALCY